MKISYYLNAGRKKNLYCRITDGSDRVTFSLEHTVDPKKWNTAKERVDDQDVHYFVYSQLKDHLAKLYHTLKADKKENVLSILKTEVESLMDNEGLLGIARNLFDIENKRYNVPKYLDFIKAFEKHTDITADQYKVQTLDSLIHFHTKDAVYEIDTYNGLKGRLTDFIEKKSFDEISDMTDERIWSEIYIDHGGIAKHEFIPFMNNEWETYWANKYFEIKKEIGRTDHLDEMKATSWRSMQVYMECFEGAGDAISLAENVNDRELVPLAIITMLKTLDTAEGYGQYCELEFEVYGEWESIDISENEEVDETPLFYIKPVEM